MGETLEFYDKDSGELLAKINPEEVMDHCEIGPTHYYWLTGNRFQLLPSDAKMLRVKND